MTLTRFISTFNPPVLRLEMVFTRGWSGLHNLSARLVISKFGVLYIQQIRLWFQASKQTIERPCHNLSYRSFGAASPWTILVSSPVHFHKRRKGGIVRWIGLLGFPGCSCIAFRYGDFTELSLFARLLSRPFSGFPTSGLAILCLSMV